MFLDLTDDQLALRDGIQTLLARRFGSDRIREGFDRAMFDELAGAGVFSLRDDGFSWADSVVVFEQLGMACVPGPLVASFLAGGGRIAASTARTAPAFVEHLDLLDVLLVIDEPAATIEMIHEPRHALAGAVEVEWPLDPLTRAWRVPSLPAGAPAATEAPDLTQRGAVLTAAFCLGMSQYLVDTSVAYAKQREQFDRPIGGFQAVKHLLADMAVRTEVARAAVYNAGAHLDDADLPGLDRSVSVAKALAGEAAVRNGKDATQVHGGMGYTWEVDVHLYLKRAWVLETQFGSSGSHFDTIAASLTSSA
jgi:alkylation response protein AidB-like acyl-CoA dehydrogenase